MKAQHDYIVGCLVGGAIGDYIGAPLEGRCGPLEVSVPLHSQITDETQLTLATCEAIISCGGPNPKAIAHTFGEWFSQGRITGMGSSTLKALRDISFGAHWALAGASGEMSAGNGSAMRIAPLAYCVDPKTPEGRCLIKDVSFITHRNDEAFAGALAIVLAITTPGFDFLSSVLAGLPDSNTRDRLHLLASETNASITDLGIRYGTSGYVADSVPIALVAASRAGDSGFLAALRSVIICGGDTDTTGSLVGQIVGSKVGLSGIPDELVSLSFGKEPVRRLAQDFADWAGRSRENMSISSSERL